MPFSIGQEIQRTFKKNRVFFGKLQDALYFSGKSWTCVENLLERGGLTPILRFSSLSAGSRLSEVIATSILYQVFIKKGRIVGIYGEYQKEYPWWIADATFVLAEEQSSFGHHTFRYNIQIPVSVKRMCRKYIRKSKFAPDTWNYEDEFKKKMFDNLGKSIRKMSLHVNNARHTFDKSVRIDVVIHAIVVPRSDYPLVKECIDSYKSCYRTSGDGIYHKIVAIVVPDACEAVF